jgi:hypothetical protein
MGDVNVGAGHFVLREARPAARAPRQRTVALVDPAGLIALLEEVPDAFDVEVGVRKVGVGPVHPLAEADGLLGDDLGEAPHALLAGQHELADPEVQDVVFGLEAELTFDLDLHPEALAIEPVLPVGVEAVHGLVAQRDVFERPAPSVVDAHWVVGGNGPIDKAKERPVSVLGAQLLEAVVAGPEAQYLLLHRLEIQGAGG